ncbi:MAG: phosphoglycerate kinase [Thermosediminibacterales bacterium]|nr:phosphoglycerate kinase [Thermosediminibacterales bacterium]
MAIKTIKDIDVKGKKVLVRVDFNVPINDNGEITDDNRIKRALPTIRYLIDNGSKVVLVSHLGRPKGKVKDELRMDPVAQRLADLLNMEVKKTDECRGPEAEKAVSELRPGEVVLLENVRFDPRETKNDPEFAKQLASLAEIFVNDAFGTAHRAHASTVGVADYLPAVAGFLMQKEIETMGKALEAPDRPFAAILGGAKVSDKIGIIENLLNKVDYLLIGGGMAFTFLKAQGLETGNSLLEEDKISEANSLLQKARETGVKMLLPKDIVVATAIDENADYKTVKIEEIPQGWIGVDIGEQTIKEYQEIIYKAKTIIWNGPMGVFEKRPFAKGTNAIAEAMGNTIDAITIIGGGDSIAAVEQMGYADKMTHISTGGGASLEFLAGKELPGVSVIPKI